MATPLTFGIELEFNVAMVLDGDEHPDPNEQRTTQFHVNPDSLAERTYTDDTFTNNARHRLDLKRATCHAVLFHIGHTIQNFGYPISMQDLSTYNYSNRGELWSVTTDGTIRPPENSAYNFAGIEVRSPAYYYSPQALAAVEKLCRLPKATYVIDTNATCGFHVHIGNARQGFPFHTIRSLAAFFWIFEHQLDSLHPPHRVDGEYCGSMRSHSNHAREFLTQHNRKLTPHEGALAIITCLDIETLMERFLTHRNSAYNFTNLYTRGNEKGCDLRKTIEFRQHEGTIDPVGVLNWIKVCHGIVAFVRFILTETLEYIVEFAENETWEKSGDGEWSRVMEQEHGPILAEERYTIVDLLRRIDCSEQAEYYEDKWWKGHFSRSEERSDDVSDNEGASGMNSDSGKSGDFGYDSDDKVVWRGKKKTAVDFRGFLPVDNDDDRAIITFGDCVGNGKPVSRDVTDNGSPDEEWEKIEKGEDSELE